VERPAPVLSPTITHRPAVRKTPAPSKAAASGRGPGIQAELDFLPPAPITPRTLKTKVEASIFCDAPVATVTHRMFAGTLDFGLVLTQYAICVSAYYFTGGGLPVNRLGYGMFAAGFLLLALFYGLIWALGNVETPGMRFARLKLTNFDGFPPEPGQRLWRYFGTCLSFATCGFGLIWAVADEESLTWQDHMSKTFPTFQKEETGFCQGR
jgi:uncharacterized RDD family membrane protein YckC